MWNLTKEAKEKFRKNNLLPIPETDEEWEMIIEEAKKEGENLYERLREELAEVRDEFIQIVPERFIPYIENGTINQPTLPKAVREEYVRWVEEKNKEFEQILERAHANTRRAVSFLSKACQEVFLDSLHDAKLVRIAREGNNVHLYLNTEGGFTEKAFVHLHFSRVVFEECDPALQVGQFLIYHELQKTAHGFAFRALLDVPDSEWTIVARLIDARYFYRPALYTKLWNEENLEDMPFEEFLKQLNRDQRYWLITPDGIFPVELVSGGIKLANGSVQLEDQELVLTVGEKRWQYNLEKYHPAHFIYTDIYEDPYEQFNEPLPIEDLEAACFSDNRELQVRAWNTMYANPQQCKDMINAILARLESTDDDDTKVALEVFVTHFYEQGILTAENIHKFRDILQS